MAHIRKKFSFTPLNETSPKVMSNMPALGGFATFMPHQTINKNQATSNIPSPDYTHFSNVDKGIATINGAGLASRLPPVKTGIKKAYTAVKPVIKKINTPNVQKAAMNIPSPAAKLGTSSELGLSKMGSRGVAKAIKTYGKYGLKAGGHILGKAAFPLAAYDAADGIYRGAKYVYNHGLNKVANNIYNDPKHFAKAVAKGALVGDYPPKQTGLLADTSSYINTFPKPVQAVIHSPAAPPLTKIAAGAYGAANSISHNLFKNTKQVKPSAHLRSRDLINPHSNAIARKTYNQNAFKPRSIPPISEAYMSYEDIMKLYEGDTDHQKVLAKTGFWGKQGAGAIIMAQDTRRILLPKRSQYVQEPDTWGVWGGAIDDGESPREAAKREIHEESGYTGKLVNIIPLYVFENQAFRYYNYLILIEREFEPRLDWETSEARWVELNNLPSPLHFGLKAVLNDPRSVAIIKKLSHGDE